MGVNGSVLLSDFYNVIAIKVIHELKKEPFLITRTELLEKVKVEPSDLDQTLVLLKGIGVSVIEMDGKDIISCQSIKSNIHQLYRAGFVWYDEVDGAYYELISAQEWNRIDS